MSPHDSKSGPNTIKLDQDEKKFNQVCLIQKLNILSEQTKDHIYRMVIVEGCCTMARSSSFRSKLFIG